MAEITESEKKNFKYLWSLGQREEVKHKKGKDALKQILFTKSNSEYLFFYYKDGTKQSVLMSRDTKNKIFQIFTNTVGEKKFSISGGVGVVYRRFSDSMEISFNK